VRSPASREYAPSSSRTRTLARRRRRTTRATASRLSSSVGLNRTPSTASHTSAGVSPSRISEVVECARSVVDAQGEELHPQLLGALAAVQAPQLTHAHCAVTFRLPRVRARDLGFDHEVRGDAFEIGVGRRRTFPERFPIAPGTLADVERAIGLYPGPGRLAPPAQARAAKRSCRARQSASRDAHDIVEDGRQVLMQARRRHQDDDPAHRVQTHPTELVVPVERRKLDDGFRVGAKDVNRGTQRSRLHRARRVHGESSAAGRRILSAGTRERFQERFCFRRKAISAPMVSEASQCAPCAVSSMGAIRSSSGES